MLRPEDLPGLFHAADEAAIVGRHSYLRSRGLQLILAILAAVGAAFTFRVGDARTDVAALGTAVAFVSILALDVGLLTSRANQMWHEGRVLAETAKTLAWKYAVCGAPLDQTLPEAQADTWLIERARQLRREFPEVRLQPTTGAIITDRMRTLRHAPFAERRRQYLEHRLRDQQRWYAAKSTQHDRRGRRLQLFALILEIVGVCAALAKAFDAIDFDLAGIVAASIAGIAAWTSARQDNRVSAAYATTSNELALVAEAFRGVEQDRWASAVAEAEEVINGEHSLWRVSHIH